MSEADPRTAAERLLMARIAMPLQAVMERVDADRRVQGTVSAYFTGLEIGARLVSDGNSFAQVQECIERLLSDVLERTGGGAMVVTVQRGGKMRPHG
jgi:hypothetical protein